MNERMRENTTTELEITLQIRRSKREQCECCNKLDVHWRESKKSKLNFSNCHKKSLWIYFFGESAQLCNVTTFHHAHTPTNDSIDNSYPLFVNEHVQATTLSHVKFHTTLTFRKSWNLTWFWSLFFHASIRTCSGHLRTAVGCGLRPTGRSILDGSDGKASQPIDALIDVRWIRWRCLPASSLDWLAGVTVLSWLKLISLCWVSAWTNDETRRRMDAKP